MKVEDWFMEADLNSDNLIDSIEFTKLYVMVYPDVQNRLDQQDDPMWAGLFALFDNNKDN
jgi:hypothetical protein